MATPLNNNSPLDLPSLEELEAMAARPPQAKAAPAVAAPQALPSLQELETLSTSNRFQQLEEEKNKYSGWFDVVRPEAIGAIGGFYNAIAGKDTPDEDIKAIADHFGADYETLRLVSPFLHAVPPSDQAREGDTTLRLLGSVSAALGDIPQFAVKKLLTDDPKLRQAMDYIRELGEERTGLAEWVAQNVLPARIGAKTVAAVAKPVAKEAAQEVAKKAAPSVLATVGEGAVAGGIFGLGGSRENEELETALLGAGVGVGLVGAIPTTVTGYRKIKNMFFGSDDAVKASDIKSKEAVIQYAKNNEADLTQATDVIYDAVKDTQAEIRDAVLAKKEMSDEAVNKIVTEFITPAEKELTQTKLTNEFIDSLPAAERKSVIVPDAVTSDRAVANEYARQQGKLFAEKIKKDVPDLASIIDETTKKPRPATSEEVLREAQRLGREELDSKWDDVVREAIAFDAIKENNIRIGDTFKIGRTIANGFGGRQFGFKVIDERTGIDALQEFYSVNTNTNLLSAVRQGFRRVDKKNPNRPTISNIYRAAKKIPNFIRTATGYDNNKYYDALRSRDFSKLSDAERPITEQIVKFFDTVRETANNTRGKDINPLNIPKREDFGLPEMPVKPTEVIIRMKGKQRAVEESLGSIEAMTKDVIDEAVASNKDFADFIAGLRLIDAEATDTIQNGKQLVQLFNDIASGERRNSKLYKVASTALARRGSIPDFLLEKNIFRVMDRYMDSTLRNVYTRRPLAKLETKANILERTGNKTDADYIRRFIEDHYGVRAWSASKLYNEAQLAAASITSDVAKKMKLNPEQEQRLQSVVAYIPEAIANVQYNIYPNVLGMNGRSHLTNLMQTLTKGAPELGGLYGYKNIGKSFFSTLIPKEYKRLREKVNQYGLQPSTFVKEYEEALEEGLARSTGWQYTKEMYQTFVRGWMKTYAIVEDVNRAAIVNISERIIQDAARGDKGAIKAINRMPMAVRRQYIKNKGNIAAQEKILAEHINSATAYNYNRASLAEVGVHLGPFFSTFTKWPTETLGDVLADIRTKGVGGAVPRLIEKYAFTYALLSALDSALYAAATGDLEASPDFQNAPPWLRYWVGRGGLKTSSPINSLATLLPSAYQPGKKPDKGPFTPILVDTVWDGILQPALNGDTEQLRKGTLKAINSIGPGGGVIRFVLRDAPMLVGEEPLTSKNR